MENTVPPSGGRNNNELQPEAETSRSQTPEIAGADGVVRDGVVHDGATRENVAGAAIGREAIGREEGGRTFSERPVAEARRPVAASQRRVLGFTWLGTFSMMAYWLFMSLAFFAPGYDLKDRIASLFLLFGVLFILMHGMGYANSMIKASWGYNEVKRRIFTPQAAPKVCCLVATFNEPAHIVEETVAALASIDYPNREIVVLDDSTREESRQAMREIGLRYGVQVVQRTNRRGYKAGAINDYLKSTDAEYVAIFDADALPAHNFLRDVVPIIQENPRIAFVQTPQHYANVDVSPVAMGASRQQSVFYEYICEGKSYSRAAFCCGTNVVFRRAALLDVEGFDESSVTEDFVTSLNMHLKGYDSAYYNQIYVYSLAPETLSAYFTQQARWAFGSVGATRKVLGAMLTKGVKMRPGQWWEYFLSSSYYWVGWVNFVFMMLPILYIFAGVKPLRQDVFTYLAIFIPYMIFTMNMFYSGMEDRGYKMGEMLLGQQINFLCFPVHMSAAMSGIVGLKRPFGVTPKGVGGRMSWLSLWFQLLMLFVSAVAFVWGMYKYISGDDRNTSAIVINSLWALYHVFLLSGVFRLNRAVSRNTSQRYFADRSSVLRSDGTLADATASQSTLGATTGGATAGGATVAAATADGRTGVPVSGQTAGGGTFVAPPRTRAQHTRRGHMATVLAVASLLLLGAGAWTMGSWWMAPAKPINVYIVDRTTGRDYQEHRALSWTLNFLKLRKQADFGPNPGQGNTNYRYASDFYGFIPGDPSTATRDPQSTNPLDLLVKGQNIELPQRLETPGVLYLVDTYGEFVEYDYHQNKYVRYRNQVRGISPDEVDRIEDFTNRKGLIIGEWNTIGYPTLPTQYEEIKMWQNGLAQTRKGLVDLTTKELPGREKALFKSRLTKDQSILTRLQGDIDKTRTSIAKSKKAIVELELHIADAATISEQIAAQKRLQKTLHVEYLGWYGRYVDKFEDEHEYDFRLWKNVQNHLSKLYKGDSSKWTPHGPGFVFYKDGPSQIYNLETKKVEDNPFAEPVVITESELRGRNSTDFATINRNEKFASDPLLRGVAAQSPCRYWFDVNKADADASVLAFYKLQVKDSALQSLRAKGFPARYLKSDKAGNAQIVFPAAIAYRDTTAPANEAKGNLRSFYFAGDASDYSLVSRINEMVPATGGISYFMGHSTGPFPTQFYWNYYEPLLQNILSDNPDVRYGGKS